VSQTRRRFLGTAASLAALAAQEPGRVSIDVGRQLFVDDLLISSSSLTRSYHHPRIHEASPILKPETALEMHNGWLPVACPFDDGLFFDPKDRLFKMWYRAGWSDAVAYAYSEDGLHWRRPNLDIEPGTNRVFRRGDLFQRDAVSIWLDQETSNPDERFKMFIYLRQRSRALLYDDFYQRAEPREHAIREWGEVHTSPDGIHWKKRAECSPCGDNTSFFYNPFRKKWVYSVRTYNERGRVRSYREHDDFIEGAHWDKNDVVFWLSADESDLPDPKLKYQTQLYAVDAVAYESLMIGILSIHRGAPNEVCAKDGFPKITDLTIAYSRDGLKWDRPDRSSFLNCSRTAGTWNRGYLHSVNGVCAIVGDELWFYFGGWSGISPVLGTNMYAGASTGLAVLRRDGFASMDAGKEQGTLTTRNLTFRGKYLFVNANVRGGELRAEVLDERGQVISRFSRDHCVPMRSDETAKRVTWKDSRDLSSLAGKPVAIRFYVTRGQLYSFWISPGISGASNGYVAAGGPGFTGPVDTIGVRNAV